MNIIFSIIAGLGFGFAAFFRKLSVQRIGMVGFILEAVFEAILAVILVSVIFPFNLAQITSNSLGLLFGVAGGISAGIGVIAFFLAARSGSVLVPSIIGPVLSALSGSLLAVVLLRESLTVSKLIGLITALVGLFIFINF